MKRTLFAVSLACMLPSAVQANEPIHLTARLNDPQIVAGFLHLDVTGGHGHIVGSLNYPYLICSQETGRTSAVSATAVDKASVQITRRDNGSIEVAATATSVSEEKLLTAQKQCAAAPFEVKSTSEKLVLRPSDGSAKFELAGTTIAISGLWGPTKPSSNWLHGPMSRTPMDWLQRMSLEMLMDAPWISRVAMCRQVFEMVECDEYVPAQAASAHGVLKRNVAVRDRPYTASGNPQVNLSIVNHMN